MGEALRDAVARQRILLRGLLSAPMERLAKHCCEVWPERTGLELKRELLEGELKQVGNVILTVLGGMIIQALIYIAFNSNDRTAMQGWAVPTATDMPLPQVYCHCLAVVFQPV